MVYLDVVRFFVKSLVSVCAARGRVADRTWRAELLFRFLRSLFAASKDQPITWLRDRQEALNLPDETRKVRFEKERIEGVDCEWCKPNTSAAASTIIVYFHGGGYVFGSVASSKKVITALALESNAWVLGVDYRLGPEHPFPAAQDDCLAVSQHILDHYSDSRVILAGDSAGGGLVLDSHQGLLERGVASKPAALLLISPWLDPANQMASMTDNEKTDVLDRQLVERWRQLSMGDTPTDHPRVNFRDMPCQDLAPIYIQAASDEIFIDQIRAFSKRVQAAGVPLRLDEYDGLFHDFQTLTPLLPEAKQALAEFGRYVKGSV